MTKKVFIILIVLLLLTGCQESATTATTNNKGPKLSTPDGMTKYLENVPAIKDVGTWENGHGPGITITTEHYQIHTTLLDPLMLRQVPAFMESAYRAYQEQLPDPIDTKTIFTIYLFAGRAQWEDFTNTFAYPHGHMYMKIKTYRLPSWLDEGIATLFEVSQYEKDSLRFIFRPERNGRLISLRNTLLKNKMIPLRQLIALNPGEVVNETDSIMAFYAQSYALVRFLREHEYGKRLKQYHNMLLGALRGNWPLKPHMQRIASDRNIPLTTHWNSFVSPMLFKSYISEDFQAIEDEYVSFCRKIVYKVRAKKR